MEFIDFKKKPLFYTFKIERLSYIHFIPDSHHNFNNVVMLQQIYHSTHFSSFFKSLHLRVLYVGSHGLL